MSTICDSRAFVKKLTEAGMPEGQADTLASENLLLIAEHLATKDDVAALRAEMHAEFSSLRGEMASEFAKVRGEMANEFAKIRGENSTEFANVRGEMAKLENRLLLKMTAIIAGLLTLFQFLD